MVRRNRRFLFAAARPRGTATWMPRLVQALVLIGLFMLPVQVRAGTEQSHPHALFQLLLDASDGVIDHHAGHDEDAFHLDHQESYPRSTAQRLDVPMLDGTIQTGGSLALITALVTDVLLPLAGAERIWPPSRHWRERFSIPESPPPRLAVG